MTQYARIANAMVFELFTPPGDLTPQQCFTPSIAAQFVAVPAGVTPEQGWTYEGGLFAAPVVATPTLAEQAAALLAAGLTISSTSTPALDGTYATDSVSQQHIQAEIIAILTNNTFAEGTSSIAWLDAAGASHTFTVAQFKAFATAVAAFVSGCLWCMNGQSTTLPSASAMIA